MKLETYQPLPYYVPTTVPMVRTADELDAVATASADAADYARQKVAAQDTSMRLGRNPTSAWSPTV